MISCCWRKTGREQQVNGVWSGRWVGVGSQAGVCLPGDVLSSRGMTFCVCHDECACRQQWLLFIHTQAHTLTHRRSNELCVVEKFSMNLLYFFLPVVILFCFVCNMLSLLLPLLSIIILLCSLRVECFLYQHLHTHTHTLSFTP